MVTDSDLLRRYIEQGSEPAFAELVSRYINLVYASAQRRVGGDAHAAKDVAQQVFTALARDARRLTHRPALTGWLYTTTRNAASHHVRAERRRRLGSAASADRRSDGRAGRGRSRGGAAAVFRRAVVR